MRMRRSWLSLFAGAFAVAAAWPAQASFITIPVTVPSTAMPWDPIANAGFAYGVNDGGPPVVIDAGSGIPFAPGTLLHVEYVRGLVSAGFGWANVDAGGDLAAAAAGHKNASPGFSGTGFPSKYMAADWDTALMALVGTFADGTGLIVGTPFEVGLARTLAIPAGAVRLQLGLNDDIFYDNVGAFDLLVSKVPEPGSLALFAFGLAGLGMLRRRFRFQARNRCH